MGLSVQDRAEEQAALQAATAMESLGSNLAAAMLRGFIRGYAAVLSMIEPRHDAAEFLYQLADATVGGKQAVIGTDTVRSRIEAAARRGASR